jgi:hypothetical protein
MKTIDAHIYVGESLFGLEQSPDELLHLMDEAGVDQAVLIPNKPKGYALMPANRMVADAIRKHPDRFAGWARVDPWQGKAACEELCRGFEDLGLRGLVLHPWEELFQVASEIVDELVELARNYQFPVLVEAGYPNVSHPLDVAELAHRFPETTFIGTHGLQLDGAAFALTDAELAMRECPNIIMETSGMYAPEVMETLVRDLGAERLMYGSHSPWLDLRLEVERARRLNVPPAAKELILGGNIARLMQI